ncbi:MAG: nicotinate phosphoribosyltransferase [Thermoprotei archaeon]|nr:MAG: nicotinate phosphoribosyltransferase [Thermoprotei archaeon]
MDSEEKFIMASDRDIREGLTTDVYFLRTVKILESEGLSDVEVYAEFTVSSLPDGYPWAILGGLREVAKLLRGLPVDVDAIPEGSVIYDRDYYGVKVPLMTIRGPYAKFAVYETPILGFLAFGSGVITKAARLRKVAGGGVLLLSFGARRMHPAVSPFISYYAYMGGCDGVSCVLGAKFLGKRPMGTMPHSLIVIYKVARGDHGEAWRAFDRVMPPEVPRVMLVDTYWDEVAETLKAVEDVGADRVWGVRLDTPSSRRGNFEDIVREVLWELRARGYRGVKVLVSGGIDEDAIPGLVRAGVAGFGVGSAIANAKIVDVAMDVVAVRRDGRWVPAAKRGKFSGVKVVYRCSECLTDVVRLEGEPTPKCPNCGSDMEPLLKPLMRSGEPVCELPSPDEVRKRVLEQLDKLDLSRKPWEAGERAKAY